MIYTKNMKKNIIIIAILSICSLGGAVAQTSSSLRTGYFLDRMTMRHKINPALVNDYGYFSIPVLGNVSLGVNSNLGVNDFLYPTTSGELNTFLHPDVSKSEAMSAFSNTNTIEQSLEMAILSSGFFGFGGYNTFDVSLKESAAIMLPKGLFSLLKGGESSYDMSGLGVTANTYVEVALGHARKVDDKLTAGVKLKALLGGATADVVMDKLLLTTSEDTWKLAAEASGEVAALGIPAEIQDDEFVFNTDDYGYSLGGSGFAIDLGATYEGLVENLTLSAAITDLGFINWRNVSNIAIVGGEVVLVDYNDEIDIDNIEDFFTEKGDAITEKLEEMTEITSNTNSSSASMLATTFTLGAEYDLLDGKITTGLLSTTRVGGGYKTFAELMAVVNLCPTKWFNVAVSGSVSNMGTYWGWVLNYSPRYFLNFFIGTDCMVSNVTPQFVPVDNVNLNLNFGFNIPIGGKPTSMRPIIKE